MGRRRGFFAEMQHQARLAEQRQRAATRQHQAAVAAAARRAEQAQRAAERAHVSATRAAEADRKRMEREAAVAHVEAMQAEAESLNAELAKSYAEIDGLLEATLAVDDYVDLEALRVVVEHPPFAHANLNNPIPLPAPIPDPPMPVREEVERPGGLFGRKRKLAEAQAEAENRFVTLMRLYEKDVADLPNRRTQQLTDHAVLEKLRVERLAQETKAYEAECEERDATAAAHNRDLDDLIAGLGYGTIEAVEEYISIVLANSVYPDAFPVEHSPEFDPKTAELKLQVTIPSPDEIPTVKSYRYVKASDEVTSTSLSQKDMKERYASVVNAVALRTLHEVFEADRRGLIQSVSIELGTNTTNPATGHDLYVTFLAAAASRTTFEQIDLSAVVPSATLEHLGASVTKNAYGLVPATTSGVRRTQ